MEKEGCCVAVVVAPVVLLGATWILNKIFWIIVCIISDTPIFGY